MDLLPTISAESTIDGELAGVPGVFSSDVHIPPRGWVQGENWTCMRQSHDLNTTVHGEDSWRCRFERAANTRSFDFAERMLRIAQDDIGVGFAVPFGVDGRGRTTRWSPRHTGLSLFKKSRGQERPPHHAKTRRAGDPGIRATREKTTSLKLGNAC
jgi:hypothetical protein